MSWADRKRRWCRAGSASEIDRIGRQVADGRKIFAERRQGRQQRQQRLRGSRLNNEAAAFFSHDGILTGQFELAGDPHRLIPAVLKNPDVPFRHGRSSLRHMPKHMATTLGLSTPLPSKPSAPAPWSQFYTLPTDPSRLHFKGGLAKNADGHRQRAVPASESTQPPPAKFVARTAAFAVRVFSRHDVTNYCSVAPCQSCGVVFLRTDISSSPCACLLGVQS